MPVELHETRQGRVSPPNVHLVFEEPAPLVYGVDRTLFVRRLEGRGHVLGVTFRPGGFRPFAAGPVIDLADRRIPAADVLGRQAVDISRAVLRTTDLTTRVELTEEFLLRDLPAPDPVAEEVAAMVDTITADPALFRVDQAADSFDQAHLTRDFTSAVGVSPARYAGLRA